MNLSSPYGDRAVHDAASARLHSWYADFVEKVGKEGYIHGWICVRPPCGNAGDKVTHDGHGSGKITSVDDKGMHAKFTDGTSGILGDEKKKPSWSSVSESNYGYMRGTPLEVNDETGEIRHGETHEPAGKIKQLPNGQWTSTPDSGESLQKDNSYTSKDEAARHAAYSDMQHRELENIESNPQMEGDVPAGALSSNELWKSSQGETKLTPDEVDAVSKVWFNRKFGATSKAMRSGKPMPAAKQKGVDTLRDVTSRSVLTKDIYTHRGIGNTRKLFGKPGSRIGQTFTDKSFVATTADPWNAQGYSEEADNPEDAIIHVHVPAGMSAFKSSADVFGDENAMLTQKEYLLPADTQFQITNDSVDDAGWRHIHLKVTGQPGKT